MDLGDLSSLGEEIGYKQDPKMPDDSWCLAYGRDKGDRGVFCKTNKSIYDLCREEYTYVYRLDNKWYYNNVRWSKKVFVPLTTESVQK